MPVVTMQAPSQSRTMMSEPNPAGSAAPILIDTRDVHVWYGKSHAIRGVTLGFPERHVVALIGPSGCGKSTFLRAINRLNDLIPGCEVTGEVIIGGHDVYSPGTDLVTLRRKVGLVFQKPNPFPRSIYENITFGPRLQGVSRKADLDALVEECLTKAALWDECKDRLQQSALGLSGGQQQRLCIARALATKPNILLMDEPCSALDPIATGKVEDLIGELKKQYTILIVTHNMQQAARVSDFTAFFFMGEVVEYDKTRVIFTNPTKKKTEEYVTGRFG
ncbi:MAG TPA: phosphate ABC transporter ATP-binding protein PstB [Tepidisphaeraceae bacterium]|nr:phosphate ABC transporter ATP-binding protein PstB [Tepidisphaeraceae bacterium]